jgi:hypothetical protein
VKRKRSKPARPSSSRPREPVKTKRFRVGRELLSSLSAELIGRAILASIVALVRLAAIGVRLLVDAMTRWG